MKIEIVKINDKFYLRKVKTIKSYFWRENKNVYYWLSHWSSHYNELSFSSTYNEDKYFDRLDEAKEAIELDSARIRKENGTGEVVATFVNGSKQIPLSEKEETQFKLMRSMLDLESEGKTKEADKVHLQLMELHNK